MGRAAANKDKCLLASHYGAFNVLVLSRITNAYSLGYVWQELPLTKIFICIPLSSYQHVLLILLVFPVSIEIHHCQFDFENRTNVNNIDCHRQLSFPGHIALARIVLSQQSKQRD